MIGEIFKLSREQRQAIDISQNIAVSAGAGSGKTRVLTSRFLTLLESGYRVEEIAAITFTEKAALEMKQRIRKAIIDRISSSEGEAKAMWMAHLDRLSRANISTIHGFCSAIVRENAPYLEIDFNSSIISEIDKAVIMREAQSAAREKYFGDSTFSGIVEELSRTYGEKFLGEGLLSEVRGIMGTVREKGESLEALLEKAADGSLEGLVFGMALEIEKHYLKYKKDRDLLDFDDLESKTLQVFENPRLRARYRGRYKTLLVDEFQDTNEVQRSIIYNLVTDDDGNLIPSKLFIVGDLKQSIYGFRGTDYTIFNRVSRDIGQEGQVALSTCYRSEKEIIEGINSIFKELIENYEPLRCPEDREGSEGRIKLVTYDKEKEAKNPALEEVKGLLKDGKASEEEFRNAFEKLGKSLDRIVIKESPEGIAVTKSIKLLRDKGLEFKDICILVRSKSTIPEIEEELKRKNLPYCIIGGRGFYQRPEVEEVLNLYRVIIRGFEGEFSYRDNLNFIKALRSPFFEIPDRTILRISIERDESKLKNLFKAMELVLDGMESSSSCDRDAVEEAYGVLSRLNALRSRLSVLQLLKAILEECRVYETMLSMEGGVQRYRNLEKLMREAYKFDSQELFTLEQFVEYIDILNDNNADDSEAALDTEDSEAIKIMTIHQSKGLEFKGVIIPRAQGDLLWVSRMHKSSLVYREGRIIPSKELGTDNKNHEHQEYYNLKLAAEVDEYIRLLYVAMTRGEDYVILTGQEVDSPSEYSTSEEKIKQLGSFFKMIKYSLEVKGAESSFIEALKSDELEDLPVFNPGSRSYEIDRAALGSRISFIRKAKPNAAVSATGYMKYQKCPRKFYIENVLRVSGENYIETDTELGADIAEGPGINAAELGTALHSVIEIIGKGGDLEEAIRNVNFSEAEGEVRRLVGNYLSLENENTSRVVKSFEELEYSFMPLEDRRLSINGFIDRLQIIEENGKYIAVITDYKTNKVWSKMRKQELLEAYNLQLQLYGKAVRELLHPEGIEIDDIRLQLYLLDTPEAVPARFDEDFVMTEIGAMDEIFARNLTEVSAAEFPKNPGRECEKCSYRSVCGPDRT